MALTEREQRFIDEYLIDANATQAAIRAGYAQNSAQEQSSRLLSNAIVKREVAVRQLALRAKARIRQEDVIREVARLAFSDIRGVAEFGGDFGVRFYESSELSEDAARSISEVSSETTFRPGPNKNESLAVTKRRIKLHPKMPALELLSKLLGFMPTAGTQNIGTQQNLMLPSGLSLEDLMKLRDDLRGNGDGIQADTL